MKLIVNRMQLQAQVQARLPILRKIVGYTVEDLANDLGISRTTMMHLETGQSEMTASYCGAILFYLDMAMASIDSAEMTEFFLILAFSDYNDVADYFEEMQIFIDAHPRKLGNKALGMKLRNYLKGELDASHRSRSDTP